MRNHLALACAVILLSAVSQAQLFSAAPITDLGTGLYLDQYQGGLYENGTNVLPSDHLTDGQTLDPQISDGTPFVFLGIGMSDVENAFSTFLNVVKVTSNINPNMTLVVGGQGGEDACEWAYAEGTPAQNGCPLPPNSLLTNPYDGVLTRLSPPKCGKRGHPACFTENDVRVVLYYDADSCRVARCRSLPASNADAFTQEMYEGMMARAVHIRYPNALKLFIVSRQYGGYATLNISPEPEAYENGFSAKWMIAAQINQLRTGVIDPVAGDLSYTAAPWVAWGAYTWASGETPSLDGLVWCQGQTDEICNGELDFQSDGTHLSKTTGLTKWANLELTSFLQEPWFVAAQ
jgi:hypothetical protein